MTTILAPSHHPIVKNLEDVELNFGTQERIPCQCVETVDYTPGGHALNFVYWVPLLRRIWPQKKYIPFTPGEPTDSYPNCTHSAEYRATFKGKYPGLGKLVTSSYTLCEECMTFWLNSKNCVRYETL